MQNLLITLNIVKEQSKPQNTSLNRALYQERKQDIAVIYQYGFSLH